MVEQVDIWSELKQFKENGYSLNSDPNDEQQPADKEGKDT